MRLQHIVKSLSAAKSGAFSLLSLCGRGNEMLPFYDGVSARQRRAEPERGSVRYPAVLWLLGAHINTSAAAWLFSQFTAHTC